MALMLPVLLLLLVGIFDLGRAVALSNELSNAVREGTRYAIVHGSASSTPQTQASHPLVDAAVMQHTAGVHPDPTITVTYLDSGSNDRGKRVKVEASFPFTPVTSSFLFGGALRTTLGSASTLVIQQ